MKFCCYCTIVAYIATEDLFRSLLVPQLLLHHHFFLSPDKECIYDYFISPLLLHVVTKAENMDVFTPNSKMVMDQISSAKMRFWNDAEHWKQMCFHHKKEFFYSFLVQRQNKRLFRDLKTWLDFTDYWWRILKVQHLALIDKNLFTWDTYKKSNKRQLLKKLWRFSFPTLLW